MNLECEANRIDGDLLAAATLKQFSVSRIERDAPYEPIGAIGVIYVFGTEIGSCAIQCTWDD